MDFEFKTIKETLIDRKIKVLSFYVIITVHILEETIQIKMNYNYFLK